MEKPTVEPAGHTISGHAVKSGQPSEEEKLLQHVKLVAPLGDPEGVLDTMDKYAQQKTWLMNVGDRKGLILDEAVRKAAPLVAVELGAYCGYSGIRIARLLQKPGARLFSIEFNKRNAGIATEIAAHAGLQDKIVMLNGTIQSSVQALKDLGVSSIDLLFIDHDKTIYLRDLKFILDQGFLKKGSIIVGDNIVYPGAPDFLHYVTTRPEFSTVQHDTTVEYTDVADMVTVTTYNGP